MMMMMMMERMKRMIGDICGQRQKALRRHQWLGQIIKTTHCSQAQLIQLKIVHEIWRLLASSVIRDQQWLIIEAYNSSKGCDGPSASQVGWEEFSKVQHNTILKTISESEPMLTWLGQGRLTTSTSYNPASATPGVCMTAWRWANLVTLAALTCLLARFSRRVDLAVFGAWTSYLGRRVLLLQCWSCYKFWITHTDSLSYTRNYINTIHPQS